jgi:hypothetical protein
MRGGLGSSPADGGRRRPRTVRTGQEETFDQLFRLS